MTKSSKRERHLQFYSALAKTIQDIDSSIEAFRDEEEEFGQDNEVALLRGGLSIAYQTASNLSKIKLS